jgi:hypothetical protein
VPRVSKQRPGGCQPSRLPRHPRTGISHTTTSSAPPAHMITNRGGAGKKTYGAGKPTTARILATLLAPMPTMPGCWATA